MAHHTGGPRSFSSFIFGIFSSFLSRRARPPYTHDGIQITPFLPSHVSRRPGNTLPTSFFYPFFYFIFFFLFFFFEILKKTKEGGAALHYTNSLQHFAGWSWGRDLSNDVLIGSLRSVLYVLLFLYVVLVFGFAGMICRDRLDSSINRDPCGGWSEGIVTRCRSV